MKSIKRGIAAGAATTWLALMSGPASAAPVASTAYGVVSGMAVGGVNEFLGIPYAAPPVGSLRFAPPQLPAPFTGVRQATTFASPCPQPASPFGSASTNEDCLYLNVFAPPGARNLPVMLWIHGGAFTSGEGSDYDGSSFVNFGNVVVVTINYRIGALGFLASPALDAASPTGTSGNYGLMDQQAAMRWVKQNIASFGGNPNNVTIFGESAGGQSVEDHLASPQASGLFQHAIIESGAYLTSLPTLSQAETSFAPFVAALGCGAQPTAACLRSVPASTYVAIEQAASANFSLSSLTSFSPVQASPTLPKQPLQAIVSGAYNNVPVLNGSNHDEFRLFTALAFDLQGAPLSAAQYPVVVNSLLGPAVGPLALTLYPLSSYASPDIAFSALLTDSTFACGALLLDQALALHNVHYSYEFNDENAKELFLPPVSFPYGAAHASELGYLWPSLKGQTGIGESFDPQQQFLSYSMIREWAAFASTASPNGHALPLWAPFVPLLNNHESLIPAVPYPELNFSASHKCTFWQPLLAAEAGLPPGLLPKP